MTIQLYFINVSIHLRIEEREKKNQLLRAFSKHSQFKLHKYEPRVNIVFDRRWTLQAARQTYGADMYFSQLIDIWLSYNVNTARTDNDKQAHFKLYVIQENKHWRVPYSISLNCANAVRSKSVFSFQYRRYNNKERTQTHTHINASMLGFCFEYIRIVSIQFHVCQMYIFVQPGSTSVPDTETNGKVFEMTNSIHLFLYIEFYFVDWADPKPAGILIPAI